MSNHRCRAADCGRVHDIDAEQRLCAFHRQDLSAGVEVRLTSGWTLWRDYSGALHARKPRKCGKMRETETNGEALRQQPSPWHHE